VASSATTLATLNEPIFDLTFDNAGHLWATTGGGPIVELDPNSGRIVASYGLGIQTGMALDPITGMIYVSTGSGVEIFNPTNGSFTPFSSTRVDGLAVDPEGNLWGASWPNYGEILEFTSHGQAQIATTVPNAVGLTFGQPGTLLAGLMLVNGSDGKVTAIDLASMQQTVNRRRWNARGFHPYGAGRADLSHAIQSGGRALPGDSAARGGDHADRQFQRAAGDQHRVGDV